MSALPFFRAIIVRRGDLPYPSGVKDCDVKEIEGRCAKEGGFEVGIIRTAKINLAEQARRESNVGIYTKKRVVPKSFGPLSPY